MKIKRQSAVLEIIRTTKIETQDELTDKLIEQGFVVTQATVSRDIRELNIVKTNNADGTSAYSVLKQSHSDLTTKLIRIFIDAVLNIDYAQNVIVVKTLSGMAQGVASALDSFESSELVGTIAGHDTVMCIVKNEDIAMSYTKKLNIILHSREENI